jgi:hypothetical protein
VDEGLRGNTITIKFKNLATADLSKGMYAKGSTIDPRCLQKNKPKGLKCPPIGPFILKPYNGTIPNE